MTETEILNEIKNLPNGIRSVYYTPGNIAKTLGTSSKKVAELFECFRICVMHSALLDKQAFSQTVRAVTVDKDICFLSTSASAQHACLAVSCQIKDDLLKLWDLVKKGGQYEHEMQHLLVVYWHPEDMYQSDINFINYVHDNFGQYLREFSCYEEFREVTEAEDYRLRCAF